MQGCTRKHESAGKRAVSRMELRSSHKDTYVCVLAVLVHPLPHFILEVQHCVVPVCQQGRAEARAAPQLVAADERRQYGRQHLTEGVMHLHNISAGSHSKQTVCTAATRMDDSANITHRTLRLCALVQRRPAANIGECAIHSAQPLLQIETMMPRTNVSVWMTQGVAVGCQSCIAHACALDNVVGVQCCLASLPGSS
mgnify:CR=1 FL=1